jgi:ankyrin repeat protein
MRSPPSNTIEFYSPNNTTPSAPDFNLPNQENYLYEITHGCKNSDESIKRESLAKLKEFITKTPKTPEEELIFKKLIFYAIDNHNKEALELILKQNPEAINFINSDLTPIFFAINYENRDALELILSTHPETINQRDEFGRSPILYAISADDIEAFELILSTNPEALNQTDKYCRSAIFYAVNYKNKKALELILKQNPESLNHKDNNGNSPIFFAIKNNNKEALELILSTNPEALNQKDEYGNTPILHAISRRDIEALKLILSTKPETLNQKDKFGISPIFYAISTEDTEALELIISTNPETLNQKDNNGNSLIFYAILKGNIKALELILKQNPEVINQRDDDKRTLLEYSLQSLHKTPQDIAVARSIVNTIYKKQFATQEEISDEDLEKMKDFYMNISHLKLGYGRESFGLGVENAIQIYNNLLSQALNSIACESSKSSNKNLFINSSLQVLESISDFTVPTQTSKENLYFINANLEDHSVYFVFHVDKTTNKLTDISYCDGNKLTSENYLAQDPNYLQGGVKKFRLDKPINFSNQFVDEFLELNTNKKNLYGFYKQFHEKGLILKDPQNQELDQTLKEPTYSVSTKIQTRGNCGFKSLKILWRYIAELKYPHLKFSRGAINQTLERLDDIQESLGESTDANIDFKEIKGELNLLAIDNLLKYKESLKDESINEKFREFLTEKIDEALRECHETAKLKIQKFDDTNGDPIKEKELKIHQKIEEKIRIATKETRDPSTYLESMREIRKQTNNLSLAPVS